MRVFKFLHKIVVFVFLVPVYFYRLVISPMSRSCQFSPTCSLYTLQSVKRFGVIRGYTMGAKRIVRCRPWGKKNGGYDPVPYGYRGGAKWVV